MEGLWSNVLRKGIFSICSPQLRTVSTQNTLSLGQFLELGFSCQVKVAEHQLCFSHFFQVVKSFQDLPFWKIGVSMISAFIRELVYRNSLRPTGTTAVAPSVGGVPVGAPHGAIWTSKKGARRGMAGCGCHSINTESGAATDSFREAVSKNLSLFNWY